LVVALLLVSPAGGARTLVLVAIHGYQRMVAPLESRAGIACRFTPTCSRYAEAVIARDGVIKGGWEALRRIARCGPWTARGTRDEP
jgi:putative membrane protein insertion efficiency factor